MMLKIEGKEVKTWDKVVSTTAEFTIKKNVFSCLSDEKTEFNSEIFKYDDVHVLVNRENCFGEHHFNIAICAEESEKVWPLGSFAALLDINIKRFDQNLFFLWTESNDPKCDTFMKQCSFFRLHENEKVDNITVDFNNLKELYFLPDNYVLVAYLQKLGGDHGVEEKIVNTLALYAPSGKMVKTIYEYYNDGDIIFDYNYDPDKALLQVFGKLANGNENEVVEIDLSALCKADSDADAKAKK